MFFDIILKKFEYFHVNGFALLKTIINMSLRFNAIQNLSNSNENNVKVQQRSLLYLAENVFTLKTAREFLSDEAYKSLMASIKSQPKD